MGYMMQWETDGTWSVWTTAPQTGDRRDWLGSRANKYQAQRFIDSLYRKAN